MMTGGEISGCAHASQNVQSVLARQHTVQQDQVVDTLSDIENSLTAVVAAVHAVSFLL